MVDIRQVSFGLNENDVVGFTEIQRTAIDMQMCISIAEIGTWKYYNNRHPRWEYAFGYAQVMSGAFVVADIPLSYINQEILHWHNSSFGIEETIACYSKAVLNGVNGATFQTNTTLLRQRFTSVRFEFFPGVLANCLMIYEVGQPLCGGNIFQPDPSAGQPPNPDNHSHDPSTRPPSQPGDPRDNSPNDGEDPASGQQQPPSTGIPTGLSCWWSIYSGLNGHDQCKPFSGEEALLACTDPDVSPVYTVQAQAACPGTTAGTIYYKGSPIHPSSDVLTMTFEYRPAPSSQ